MYGHLRSNDAVEIICEQGDAGSVEPYAACLKSPSDRFIASRRLEDARALAAQITRCQLSKLGLVIND
jgi:hypothetical protein